MSQYTATHRRTLCVCCRGETQRVLREEHRWDRVVNQTNEQGVAASCLALKFAMKWGTVACLSLSRWVEAVLRCKASEGILQFGNLVAQTLRQTSIAARLKTALSYSS